MPVFHTKTIESILEPVAQQVSRIMSQKRMLGLMFTSDNCCIFNIVPNKSCRLVLEIRVEISVRYLSNVKNTSVYVDHYKLL